MYTKLILATLCSLALAAPQHPPAAQYPAGVNPQDCPGFPICDNARLHNPQAHWGAPAAPAWNQPAAHAWQQPAAHGQWNAHEDDGQYHHNAEWDRDTWSPHQAAHAPGAWNAPAPAWNAPAPAWNAPAHAPATAAADRFPAGVSPHACPNYPYCDVNAAGHAAAAPPPLPGWNERLYPAGVSPHSCPNFPYCH